MRIKPSFIGLIIFLLVGCKIDSEKNKFVTNDLSIDPVTHLTKPQELTHPQNHEGEWLLTSNLFDSLLTFRRIELSDSLTVYGKKFTFEKETLKYEDFNPVPSSGNGMFYMDTCDYQMKDDDFIFYFKGGYLVESSFEYRAKYTLLSVREKQIRFKRTKTFKHKKKSIFEEIEKINKSL